MKTLNLIFLLFVIETKLFVNFMKSSYFIIKLTHLRPKLSDLRFVRNVLAYEYSMLLLQKKDALFKNRGRAMFVNKSFDLGKEAHRNFFIEKKRQYKYS